MLAAAVGVALCVAVAAFCGLNALLLIGLVVLAAVAAARAAPRPSSAWPRPFALARALVRRFLEIFGALVVENALAASAVCWLSAAVGTGAGRFVCWQLGVALEPLELYDLEHIWLKPTRLDDRDDDATRVVVLYYHGGGYALLSPRMYITFACELRAAIQRELDASPSASKYRVEFLLANYRKTPEHRYPVAAEDATAMYEYLLDVERVPASSILMAGDSAGAGLAMSTLLRTKRQNTHPLPRAVLLLCPFVDLSDEKETRRLTDSECGRRSPYCLLSNKFVRAAKNAYLPVSSVTKEEFEASAVHCDLSGLPPAIVQVGSHDILLPQSRALVQRAPSSWKLDEHALMPHAFAIFPSLVLPHVEVAHRRLARFAAAQLSSTASVS